MLGHILTFDSFEFGVNIYCMKFLNRAKNLQFSKIVN